MKNRFWIIGLVSCAVFPLSAQDQAKKAPAPPAVTQTDAITREQQLFDADQKHDMAKIISIVADEFIDIARDGGIIGKQALLKEIPTITMVTYALQNWFFHSMGPFAYSISYDSDATVVQGGKQVHSQNRLNSVWLYRDGRWQMLLHSRGSGQGATK
jgi:hypothetical protein